MGGDQVDSDVATYEEGPDASLDNDDTDASYDDHANTSYQSGAGSGDGGGGDDEADASYGVGDSSEGGDADTSYESYAGSGDGSGVVDPSDDDERGSNADPEDADNADEPEVSFDLAQIPELLALADSGPEEYYADLDVSAASDETAVV
jgi:hypothetical protein